MSTTPYPDVGHKLRADARKARRTCAYREALRAAAEADPGNPALWALYCAALQARTGPPTPPRTRNRPVLRKPAVRDPLEVGQSCLADVASGAEPRPHWEHREIDPGDPDE